MRTIILAGAAALSFGSVPAIAQSTMTMTTEQQAMYDGWTAENRATYEGWPVEARSYYWTLTPEQTTGWWALTDEQRVRIVGMTPDQRMAAWNAINAQMGSRASADASTTGQMASSGTMTGGAMQFVRREMAQTTAGSADAGAPQSGDLPVCKKGQQDGCINGWEKNKTGNKPLSYWPGRPASEIPGKKPDPQ
jgi:hypothetical protein